jgi:glycosyltransferase involved in cell wall biosynthesis
VPTLNEAERLPLLLASLKAQTVPPDEILIADSGSTDGTVEIASASGARVLHGERKGPGEGRNRGARGSSGDLLVFVDADCVVPRDLLEAVRLAAADPAVIGGAASFSPEEGTPTERLLYFLANGYQRAAILWGMPHNAGYCFFFRRDTFERLGGIREDLLLNETHDVALRSRGLGRFVALPVTVRTSMRRLRAHGLRRTVLWEYVTSTLLYYVTGQAPRILFRPTPVRTAASDKRA